MSIAFRLDQLAVVSAECPLCHTIDQKVTSESLRAGASWACTRCGQTWDAQRLETAAAYAQFAAARMNQVYTSEVVQT